MGGSLVSIDQRVLYETADISLAVGDYRTLAAAVPLLSTEYIYIGQPLPFQNLFIEMGTANTNPATVSAWAWYANAWTPLVDVRDQTAGLTTTGRLEWTIEWRKGWDRELKATDVTGITADIYDMYWMRLKWSANLSAGTTIKYIGQKFSTDEELYSFYPDLNNSQMKTSFATGKTTWDEQHYMAAEHILRDLKRKNVIVTSGQIVDYRGLLDASCHKVAEIIYSAMGKAYVDQLTRARKLYTEALDKNYYLIDRDGDSRITDVERRFSVGFMSR